MLSLPLLSERPAQLSRKSPAGGQTAPSSRPLTLNKASTSGNLERRARRNRPGRRTRNSGTVNVDEDFVGESSNLQAPLCRQGDAEVFQGTRARFYTGQDLLTRSSRASWAAGPFGILANVNSIADSSKVGEYLPAWRGTTSLYTNKPNMGQRILTQTSVRYDITLMLDNRMSPFDIQDFMLEFTASEPEQATSCIDLTVDTPSTDVIDLTRRNSVSLMDSPVVILTPADHVGPVRRRRGSGRRGRHRSNSGRSVRTELFTSGDSHVHVLLSGDSDSDEMPDVPFEVPDFSVASNETILRSPEGVKISCPVCLDDTKQIQRSGKVVVSTTCGHIFCDECIKAAINAQHACPTCRKKLYQRNVHPLFI